jgi:HlyD family secretion protein
VAAGSALINQAEAQAANAQADYERKKTLVAQGVYSPSVLDLAKATYLNSEAAIASARARLTQSQAALDANRVDLRRTTIVAPIDGVVVDRKINPGQTVAASFTAPVLFTLAQDLSKLQVKISVDEADVGQVQARQAVRFTVDAYPDEIFQGVVTQVRKQPTTEQNVVAYTVIAEAANPRNKLLPGMTANADIVIDTHANVLRVPAAALRWRPPPPVTRPGQPPPVRASAPASPHARGRTGTIYVLRAGKPERAPVTVGAADGIYTEIAGAIRPGDQVIVGGGPKGLGGAQVRIGM